VIPGPRDFWFLPLGGCGEIGMNLNLFGHDGQWLLVDCGITFEQPDGPGSRRMQVEMPDIGFLLGQRSRIAGLVATHAHEDHIGALPYLWKDLACPVHTTAFTAAVIRAKSRGRSGVIPDPLLEVRPGETRRIGPFTVTWLPITHSTPETCALLIETPAGRVLHTADWKIDPDPVVGEAFQQGHFQAAGQRGLDAVICDSTNATRPGRSVSEASVREGLSTLVRRCEGRVVVGCFASNIARLRTLSAVARSSGRYLALYGRSLETLHGCARATSLLGPREVPINPAHAGYLPRHEVLAVATGSQGEPRAALQRLAMDSHPHLSLEAGDTVIFSAKTIPGNEVAVNSLVQRFRDRGIVVRHADDDELVLHASGHPCAEELADLYGWLSPRLAVPVHGEAQHMKANADIARSAGVPLALTGRNGDLFYLCPEPGLRRRAAPTGRLMVGEDGELAPVISAARDR
jgi:ribonuclease J